MTRALVAALGAALACSGSALAKGPIDLRICGATECRAFAFVPGKRQNADLVTGLVDADQSFVFQSPPRLGPWYELALASDSYELFTVAYAPEAGVVKRKDTWIAVTPRTRAALRQATRGLAPRPRPIIERALVNGLPSANPSVYAGMFGPLPPAPAPPPGTPAAEIRLATRGQTPWTDGRRIEYFPAANVLRRSGEWVAAPDALARRIEEDLTTVRKEADGLGWPAVASVLLLAAGLAAAAWATLRRRRHVGRVLRPARR